MDNKQVQYISFKQPTLKDESRMNKSIGNSTFKLVYGTDVVFPIQLILPVAKFLQEEQDEENDMVRRMNNLDELQQIIEQLVEKSKVHKKKIKETFYRKAKVENF